MTYVPKARLDRSPAPEALALCWKQLAAVNASIKRNRERQKRDPDRLYRGRLEALDQEKSRLLRLLNLL